MTSHELASKLLEMPEKECLVFVAGELYPALVVQIWDDVVEIGCGWQKLGDVR